MGSLIYYKSINGYTGTYIQNNKIKLWTETFGNKQNPALLLISGAMAPARLWNDNFCSQISKQGFFVIRYDLRDSGLSSGIDYEENPYDLDDLVADSIAILDHFNLKKVFTAGISMGGSIAQLFALQHPERCLGTILISSPTPGVHLSLEEKKKLKKTWELFRENKPSLDFEEGYPGFLKSYTYLNGSFPINEGMVKSYVRDMYERTNFLYKKEDGQIKAFEDPHNHVRAQYIQTFSLSDLAQIKAPTLIIHGDQDPIVFPVNALTAAKYIKDSQLSIIKGMGHMIFNRNLEHQVVDKIVQFMKA